MTQLNAADGLYYGSNGVDARDTKGTGNPEFPLDTQCLLALLKINSDELSVVPGGLVTNKISGEQFWIDPRTREAMRTTIEVSPLKSKTKKKKGGEYKSLQASKSAKKKEKKKKNG